MPNVKNVGEKVRKIREFKNLSQDELAESSKLSKELIARIEESKELPFLAPLIRISRVLGVKLGTFLDDNIQLGPVVERSGAKKSTARFFRKDSSSPSDMNFFPLASDKAGRHMEPFLVDVKPSKDGEFTLSTHEGEEFVFVLSGDVELTYGTEVYQLSAGDSIYYDSVVGHHLNTSNDLPARILAVVYAPF